MLRLQNFLNFSALFIPSVLDHECHLNWRKAYLPSCCSQIWVNICGNYASGSRYGYGYLWLYTFPPFSFLHFFPSSTRAANAWQHNYRTLSWARVWKTWFRGGRFPLEFFRSAVTVTVNGLHHTLSAALQIADCFYIISGRVGEAVDDSKQHR